MTDDEDFFAGWEADEEASDASVSVEEHGTDGEPVSEEEFFEGWEADEEASDVAVEVEYKGFVTSGPDTTSPDTGPGTGRPDASTGPDETGTVDPDDPGPSDEEPATTPAPSPDTDPAPSHDRGELVFPADDSELVQAIELRGNNGVQRDVETKYLLTGSSYTTPTDMIGLDDPSLYEEMTETSLVYNVTAIADYVAKLHEGYPDPKVVVAVHTHPSGNTIPSSTDRTNSTALRDELERHFDDFEFFQGIHGLQERTTPTPDKLREVHAGDGHIWWYGENRRHELAIFDGYYNPCEVHVR